MKDYKIDKHYIHMKQVLNQDVNVISVENVDDRKYYGFDVAGDSRGYIAADDMMDNPNSYAARFFNYMTRGNPWKDTCSTLQGCIANLLLDKHATVFEFDTYQELLKWGSQL